MKHVLENNLCEILVGKSKGRRPLVRSRHRLDDNNKMDLTGKVCDILIWIHLDEIWFE